MLIRDPKERADTVELIDHPFLQAGDGNPGNLREGIGEMRSSGQKPFSQVVTQGQNSLITTTKAAGDTEVFGTLPRGQNIAGGPAVPLGQGGGPPSGGANPYHQSQIPNLAGRGGGVGAAPAGSAQMLSGTISRAAPPGSGMPQFGDLGSDGTRLSGQDGRLSAAHAQQQQPNYMQSTLGSTTTSGRVAQLGPKGQSTPLPSGTYVGSSSQSYCSLSGGSPATNSSSASQHPHHHHPPPAPSAQYGSNVTTLGATGSSSAGNAQAYLSTVHSIGYGPNDGGGGQGGQPAANPYVAAAAAAAQRLRETMSVAGGGGGGMGGTISYGAALAQHTNNPQGGGGVLQSPGGQAVGGGGGGGGGYWNAKKSELESRLGQGGGANVPGSSQQHAAAAAANMGGAVSGGKAVVGGSSAAAAAGGATAAKRRDEKLAVSTAAAEQAANVRQQQSEQEIRLQQERAKKKVLWEQELQKELEFQRSQKAERERQRRSLGGGGGGSVYPE